MALPATHELFSNVELFLLPHFVLFFLGQKENCQQFDYCLNYFIFWLSRAMPSIHPSNDDGMSHRPTESWNHRFWPQWKYCVKICFSFFLFFSAFLLEHLKSSVGLWIFRSVGRSVFLWVCHCLSYTKKELSAISGHFVVGWRLGEVRATNRI